MSTVISYIRCDCGSSLRVRGDDDRTLSEIGRFFKRHFKCLHADQNDPLLCKCGQRKMFAQVQCLDCQKVEDLASPVFCEHANEVPAQCPCELGCYCKTHTYSLVPQDCSQEYGHSGPCNGWPCAYVRKKLDFARHYGMSGVKATQLTQITDQEALEKLERMFGQDKTPRQKSKYYSLGETLKFKPLRDALRRFFDTDGPYI